MPHIERISAQNVYARTELIPKYSNLLFSIGGGGHVEVISRVFSKFRLEHLNFPEEMKRRGVDDSEMVSFKPVII